MTKTTRGFTLVEMSIVLVIIGLVIAGILVGKDLIGSAGARGQVAQIQKYQSAVNTFKSKYNGYLPGDIAEPDASRFGFLGRGSGLGQGDGNGIIEGAWSSSAGGNMGIITFAGETAMLWEDLSKANLVDGGFNTAGTTGGMSVTLANVPLYMPAAKIGQGNFVYVWSGGWKAWLPSTHSYYSTNDGYNYFGLSAVIGSNGSLGSGFSNPGLTVAQAYAIDSKMDDGMPQSGNVMAMYQTYGAMWASGGPTSASGETVSGAYTAGTGAPTSSATPASATTCYDNNNSAGFQQYSMSQNGGQGVNCALSFKFQ